MDEKNLEFESSQKKLIPLIFLYHFLPVLMTANFKFESTENLDALLALQPNRPILVSEFWPGWFDHWFEPIHNTLNIEGTNLISMFYGSTTNHGATNIYRFFL